jgi:hypothetical protein
MKTVVLLALLGHSQARYQSLASAVDADSFDGSSDTAPSTALKPGDAAEPINKVEASPEMETAKGEAKK